MRPLGLSVLGVGLASVVAGAVFGGIAIARKNQSDTDDHCDVLNRCDADGLRMRQEALNYATGSTWLLIAGTALAAGGTILWLTAPRKGAPEKRSGLRVSPGFVAFESRW